MFRQAGYKATWTVFNCVLYTCVKYLLSDVCSLKFQMFRVRVYSTDAWCTYIHMYSFHDVLWGVPYLNAPMYVCMYVCVCRQLQWKCGCICVCTVHIYLRASAVLWDRVKLLLNLKLATAPFSAWRDMLYSVKGLRPVMLNSVAADPVFRVLMVPTESVSSIL